jgi:flagellin
MRIQNNPAAFSVWTSYTNNVNGMKNSMGRLSTGMIKNTDDAAGIGISERMRAQIKGTSMARSNVENAVSLMQTADSWMQKMSDMLARMKSLAIEAKGIMDEGDKANVASEFTALQEELQRITSKSTAAGKFNGLYLFRGGNGVAQVTKDQVKSGNISVQIGADINQTVSLTLKNLSQTNSAVIGTTFTYTYDTEGVANASTRTAVKWNSILQVASTKQGVSVSQDGVVGKIDVAINFVANARATVAAQQKRLEYTGEGLLTYEDNLRAAESKVRDVDMARESTDFTKFQILTNAANAMLAQANGLPQNVLQLLG